MLKGSTIASGEALAYVPWNREMSTDKIIEIEKKIADLKARWLAHSMPPSMWQQLEELEGELEKAIEGVGKAPYSLCWRMRH